MEDEGTVDFLLQYHLENNVEESVSCTAEKNVVINIR